MSQPIDEVRLRETLAFMLDKTRTMRGQFAAILDDPEAEREAVCEAWRELAALRQALLLFPLDEHVQSCLDDNQNTLDLAREVMDCLGVAGNSQTRYI